MSTKIDDGGQAFPSSGDYGSQLSGMSLRDWFAGQIIAGIMADTSTCLDGPNGIQTNACAQQAWELADVMIRARKTGV